MLDPVDQVLPFGAEDVEVTGDGEVLVLVAGEAAPLQVHDQSMGGEEVGPRIGFLTSASKSQVYLLLANCKGIILDP